MSQVLTTDQVRDAETWLDDEAQIQAFRALGEEFFAVFTEREGRINTQVRNLQQIVVSARRLADVEDFVKNQMGKTTQASPDWRRVGDRVLEQLARLRKQAADMTTDEGQRVQLRLFLARGWVRAVVGAYLYARAQREMQTNHG